MGDESSGMMVMMTPEMMQMMMGMMADHCMMMGKPGSPRHGESDRGPGEMARGTAMMQNGDEMRRGRRMRERMEDRPPMFSVAPTLITVEDVRRVVSEHLAAYGNPRLRLGAIAPAGEDAITAVVETVDGSLVERLVFDRFTGQFARTGE